MGDLSGGNVPVLWVSSKILLHASENAVFETRNIADESNETKS